MVAWEIRQSLGSGYPARGLDEARGQETNWEKDTQGLAAGDENTD